ncbi:uncharacterized protein LOC110854664 [Folsomia candida]|nr:uncharacterized protein LOC110854664 [Folsomia candida]
MSKIAKMDTELSDLAVLDFVKLINSTLKMFPFFGSSIFGANSTDTLTYLDARISRMPEGRKNEMIEFVHRVVLHTFLGQLEDRLKTESSTDWPSIIKAELPNLTQMLNFMSKYTSPLALERLAGVVKALHAWPPRTSEYDQIFELPIVLWHEIEYCRNFPLQFARCNCVMGASPSFTLVISDAMNLNHCTNSVVLIEMLYMGRASTSMTNGIEFKGSRKPDLAKKKDICAQGLTHFSVDLKEFAEKIHNKNALKRRYGAVEICVEFGNIFTAEKEVKVFRLGTRIHPKEFSQKILASDFGDEWWLLNEKKGLHKLGKMETRWPINYCTAEKNCWTHPEVVIPGTHTVDFAKVKIKFRNGHECIVTKDGRRGYCIECEIYHNFEGKCSGKVGEDWKEFNFGKLGTANLAMKMFAYKCPLEKRDWIKDIQEKYKMFDENQFGIITQHWEQCKDWFVTEWRALKF